MDTFECKKIMDGLWELGKIEEIEEIEKLGEHYSRPQFLRLDSDDQASIIPKHFDSDKRVLILAQWLTSTRILDYPNRAEGAIRWHLDMYYESSNNLWKKDEFSHVLVMCNREPGTEIGKLASIINDNQILLSTCPARDFIPSFIIKPKHIYLMDRLMWHRGPEHLFEPDDRILSRVTILLRSDIRSIL